MAKRVYRIGGDERCEERKEGFEKENCYLCKAVDVDQRDVDADDKASTPRLHTDPESEELRNIGARGINFLQRCVHSVLRSIMNVRMRVYVCA